MPEGGFAASFTTGRRGGDSPHDQACYDGGPGDAAGLRPLGVFVDVFAAAAQADQVDGEDQQAQAQADGADAGQSYQRLRGEDNKNAMKQKKISRNSVKMHLQQKLFWNSFLFVLLTSNS